MSLYGFKSRRLCWIYRLTGPLLILLWTWALVAGMAWYWVPTTVGSAVIWGYFSVSAWIKGTGR